MNIALTDEALQWFKQEMEVEPGDTIRFMHVMVALVRFMKAFRWE